MFAALGSVFVESAKLPLIRCRRFCFYFFSHLVAVPFVVVVCIQSSIFAFNRCAFFVVTSFINSFTPLLHVCDGVPAMHPGQRPGGV